MKGFRTLAAAVAITTIGALQQSGVVNLIPEHYQGIAVSLAGVLMAALRMATNTAVAKSE